jgi:hypothetical protein
MACWPRARRDLCFDFDSLWVLAKPLVGDRCTLVAKAGGATRAAITKSAAGIRDENMAFPPG